MWFFFFYLGYIVLLGVIGCSSSFKSSELQGDNNNVPAALLPSTCTCQCSPGSSLHDETWTHTQKEVHGRGRYIRVVAVVMCHRCSRPYPSSSSSSSSSAVWHAKKIIVASTGLYCVCFFFPVVFCHSAYVMSQALSCSHVQSTLAARLSKQQQQQQSLCGLTQPSRQSVTQKKSKKI